ncbi:helix-turn-helix domain containing protein [Marinobacter koreensis]|nr:helix-turn-helix domain containing protein [Marinobacter koreensis]
MSRIADRLDVARTSVLNWKRHGGIQAEHIKGLAEITGFNFWWLAFGEGPKLGNDKDILEFTIQKMIETSPEHAALLHRQAQMTASGALTRKLAKALTRTLEAIPAKEPT